MGPSVFNHAEITWGSDGIGCSDIPIFQISKFSWGQENTEPKMEVKLFSPKPGALAE